MNRTMRHLALLAASSLLLANCNDADPEENSLALTEQAVNVCNTTPATHLIVDGIPAYAQCTASSNSAIYSNNGVDTATSAASSDWKRTQFSGGYQCTELVHRYWLFKWNVTWLPNGDAWSWCNSTPPSSSGIIQTTTPVHGDTIVFGKGSCGADATYGHVALVDTVDTAGSKVTFVEQNNAGRRTAAFSCATCFLHVVANTGSGGAGGAGGATATTGGTTTTANGGTSSTGGTSTKPAGGTSSTGGTSTKPAGGASSTGGAMTTANGGAAVGGTASTSGGQSNSTGGVAPTDTVVDEGGASTGSAVGGTAAIAGGNASTTTATSEVAVDTEDEEVAGCSCSVPNRQAQPHAFSLFALGAALLLRTRGRRSRPKRGAQHRVA